MAEKCPKHPRYQVKRRPRADCPACWDLWYAKHPEERTKARGPEHSPKKPLVRVDPERVRAVHCIRRLQRWNRSVERRRRLQLPPKRTPGHIKNMEQEVRSLLQLRRTPEELRQAARDAGLA